MSYATRLKMLLTALRLNRDDAAAGERIQAIKARLDAATPGLWVWEDRGHSAALVSELNSVCGRNDGYILRVDETQWLSGDPEEFISGQPDAQLIAGAPEDAAFLLIRLDEVERRLANARGDLQLAQTEMARLENVEQTAYAEQWTAADENERLKAQVAELLPFARVGAAQCEHDELFARINAAEFGGAPPLCDLGSHVLRQVCSCVCQFPLPLPRGQFLGLACYVGRGSALTALSQLSHRLRLEREAGVEYGCGALGLRLVS